MKLPLLRTVPAFTVMVTVIGLSMPVSQAAPIASESFATSAGGNDYPIGPIAGRNPTVGCSGFNGGWNTGTSAMEASRGGLTHDLTPGEILDGELIPSSRTSWAVRHLSRPIDYTPDTGTYYMSVVLQKHEVTNLRDIFVGLGKNKHPETSPYSIEATYIGIYDGGISFFSPGLNITQLLDDTEVNVGEPYFALMQYDLDMSGADTVTATIFDSASNQVANRAFLGLDLDTRMDHFSLLTDNFAPIVAADEWRFGTELDDVMRPGPPVGDYNANGTVEQADLDLVLLNWGQTPVPVPQGWINDFPTPDFVDQDELDRVLLNWGNSSASANVVPEPGIAWLLLVGFAVACVVRRRTH